MRPTQLTLLLLAFLITYCSSPKQEFDATGTFEAEETIISSEVTGAIKELKLEEGQQLKAGEYIGYIDSLQLHLRKKQLQAQIEATLSRKPNIATQLTSLQEQLKAAETEQRRIGNMVAADAATPKQLDDANAQVKVLKGQIAAQRSSLGISTESIGQEVIPLQVQIEQVEDQLKKSQLLSPMTGTVLTKYAEEHELAAPGKPLYKMADLFHLTLRAYISCSQLPAIKLGQQVKVLVGTGKEPYREYTGTISWISDKSEFTPKTIQTKEERASLVYAVKIIVKNDGLLKTGMYAEVKF